ncbi:MAG: LLM class flavin-dependent oxidoreductase [Chthoniobacteraceae bacterium]
MPNVSGGLVISNIEQRTELGPRLQPQAGPDRRTKRLRICAEPDPLHRRLRRGVPARAGDFHHALLEATERLNSSSRCCPGRGIRRWRPEQLATLDQITGGRVAINVVSGWFRGEFAAIGEPWLEHDERYRRSEEFIRALKGIWTEESFSFAATSTASAIIH